MRQTVLGIDARGPHLFNARTHADVRVDFDGASLADGSASSYAGGLLRLRTAHASLNWNHTDAFFSLDHAIVAPNSPSSLTAVAIVGTRMVRQSLDVESAGGADARLSIFALRNVSDFRVR